MKNKNELVNINSIPQIQSFSKELKKFIVEQDLYSDIQGKNYAHVEGWQFAGAALGLTAIVKKVKDLSNEKEIKYRAKVEVLNLKNNQLISTGVAICSNKEPHRKNADEYVIISMAQTRAIGKAFRNKFAFIMKMAGYEASPWEEVVNSKVNEINDLPTPKSKIKRGKKK